MLRILKSSNILPCESLFRGPVGWAHEAKREKKRESRGTIILKRHELLITKSLLVLSPKSTPDFLYVEGPPSVLGP